MKGVLSAGLALLTLSLCTTLQAGTFYAAQITGETRQRVPAGGLDAVGGLGDWFLSDGELCAVISDISHPTYLSLNGGALVDLWHCDKANDQWSVAHTQLNLQQDQIPPFDTISAGASETEAWVVVSARNQGLETSVRYSLQASAPGEIQLKTRIRRYSEGPSLSMFGVLTLHPSASLLPYSIDSTGVTESRGFRLPDVDTGNWLSVLSSLQTSDLQVLLGSQHIEPQISYGLRVTEVQRIDSEGGATPLASFMVGSEEFTMFGAFTGGFPEFWANKPGLFSFGLGQLFDLDMEEAFVFRQSIAVRATAAASPFTDELYSGHHIKGRVDSPRAAIEVLSPDGEALTFARADASGAFSFTLPAQIDSFSMELRTPWSTRVRDVSTEGDLDLGLLETGAPARVALPHGNAMSLLFLREDGDEKAPQLFHSELTNTTVGGERHYTGPESLRLNLAGTDTDPRVAELPAGAYRIIASRGPEFTATETRLRLESGEDAKLVIDAPRRAVETPGLLGVDFHVHSGISFDSSLLPRQRIIDFVAQGGEVLATTEHNISYDLQPLIESMGLADRIRSIGGVELTGMVRSDIAPTAIGHSNVFPVDSDPEAFSGGTLPFEGKRLGQVIDAYKQRHPDSIFQLNHPRSEHGGSDNDFFDHLSFATPFDPKACLCEEGNASLVEELPGTRYRDIDFDAMELLNGGSMVRYELVRADWFALLRENQFKIATANSDSHKSAEIVASPRTYVALDKDNPGSAEIPAIIDAVRRGAVYGSTGPILTVTLADKGPGETVTTNSATLRVLVSSAPWIDADEIRIWINGELWKTAATPDSGAFETPVEVDRDSYVFVEVYGEAGELYTQLLPGFQPFAFANPVFIDVDGDGWRFGE